MVSSWGKQGKLQYLLDEKVGYIQPFLMVKTKFSK